MVLIDLGSDINKVITTGSCVHLIHTYYNKDNEHSIPNVAIVGQDKIKGFYSSPGGKLEKGEFPYVNAARTMLEGLSIRITKKNIQLVVSKLNYIGSLLNQDRYRYTHNFVLNLVGYSTTDKVYTKHVEFRYVPIDNMDSTTICDVHGNPLNGTIKSMNIAAFKAASKMSMNTIHISELE
jgi:hypothetical protein